MMALDAGVDGSEADATEARVGRRRVGSEKGSGARMG